MRPKPQGTPQALAGALTPAERPEGPHRTPTTALATLGRSARALERLEGWLAGRTLEDGALADYLAQLFDAGRSPAVAGQVVAAVASSRKARWHDVARRTGHRPGPSRGRALGPGGPRGRPRRSGLARGPS